MDDLDRVVDLWVALADEQRRYGSHVLPEKNRESIRMLAAQRAVDGEVILAREGDATIGFLMFDVERGTYERSPDRGIVQYVYVLPGQRGRGVGSALFDAAESALAERDADVIALSVMADNEDARRFYRRRGYRLHRVAYELPLEDDAGGEGG